jgi:hypothetical protein
VTIVPYIDRAAPFPLDPAIALLGNVRQGAAFDFLSMRGYVRDRGTPANFFLGDPNDKLTYTSPSPKYVMGANGLLSSGTALRCDHDAAGNPLGLLVEGARTNVVLRNRDLTNAAWTKTNITAAKDQVGVDGEANSASSIEATAGNGTVLQSITLASSARFQSAYVKRLVGTGTIEMTMNGGSTWTAVTVTASWTRVSIPTATLANPNVGFRIVTSGDKIAVDFVQNENGAFASSPVATEASQVTRAADAISWPFSEAPGDGSEGTIWVRAANLGIPASGAIHEVLRLRTDANNYAHFWQFGSSPTSFSLRILNAGTPVLNLAQAGWTADVKMSAAMSWAAGDLDGAVNGTIIGGTTSSAPSFAGASFGIAPNQGAFHVEHMGWIPEKVSNAELQARTAP